MRGFHIVQDQANLLDLQHHLNDIFPHARNVAELMQHIRDADRGDRRAVQRGEQHAAQGIAQRHAVTPFQGADHKFAIIASFSFALDFRRYHVT